MLFKLLAAPLLAPLQFVEWVSETIEGAAQAQLHDTEAIKAELVALEKRLESGELSEDEFEAIEIVIVRRLQEASRRMAAAGKHE